MTENDQVRQSAADVLLQYLRKEASEAQTNLLDSIYVELKGEFPEVEGASFLMSLFERSTKVLGNERVEACRAQMAEDKFKQQRQHQISAFIQLVKTAASEEELPVLAGALEGIKRQRVCAQEAGRLFDAPAEIRERVQAIFGVDRCCQCWTESQTVAGGPPGVPGEPRQVQETDCSEHDCPPQSKNNECTDEGHLTLAREELLVNTENCFGDSSGRNSSSSSDDTSGRSSSRAVHKDDHSALHKEAGVGSVCDEVIFGDVSDKDDAYASVKLEAEGGVGDQDDLAARPPIVGVGRTTSAGKRKRGKGPKRLTAAKQIDDDSLTNALSNGECADIVRSIVDEAELVMGADCALFLSAALQAYLCTAVVPGVLRCGSQRRGLTAKRCGDLVEWGDTSFNTGFPWARAVSEADAVRAAASASWAIQCKRLLDEVGGHGTALHAKQALYDQQQQQRQQHAGRHPSFRRRRLLCRDGGLSSDDGAFENADFCEECAKAEKKSFLTRDDVDIAAAAAAESSSAVGSNIVVGSSSSPAAGTPKKLVHWVESGGELVKLGLVDAQAAARHHVLAKPICEREGLLLSMAVDAEAADNNGSLPKAPPSPTTLDDVNGLGTSSDDCVSLRRVDRSAHEKSGSNDPTQTIRLPSTFVLCSDDVLLFLDQQCSPPFLCPGIQSRCHTRACPSYHPHSSCGLL